MSINKIDAKTFQKMFIAGAGRIDAKKDYINELNVFPVPDGDTGTNMSLTIKAAAKEVINISEPTMAELSKAVSGGSLRGARGNSGVILSQLFRGFCKEMSSCQQLDNKILAKGFLRAVETAYKAVMKPKEGTILTVARGLSDKAIEMANQTDDVLIFFKEIIAHGNRVLSKTPEMLPVLKEAGVVDSGGQGLMEIIQGFEDALLGRETDYNVSEEVSEKAAVITERPVVDYNIEFGYCTEFIINLEKENPDVEKDLKTYLATIGDSLVVVADDDIVKVHVHSNHPGQAIEKALTYGSLSNLKIDNMREEHEEKLIKDASKIAKAAEIRKAMGFITVSIGEGLNEIFKGLGIDYVIAGGQTMNPSTEDMLNAISKVNAETIFILPNNKNIILAAEQAKALVKDKEIIVIPTKTIPEGIGAIINFNSEVSPKENEKTMLDEIHNVSSGQVTYAVRDTTIDGKMIKEGNIMGIHGSAINAVGTEVDVVVKELIANMVTDDSSLISLYYGSEVNEADANKLLTELEEIYVECDIEMNYGGQPIYYYIISVE